MRLLKRMTKVSSIRIRIAIMSLFCIVKFQNLEIEFGNLGVMGIWEFEIKIREEFNRVFSFSCFCFNLVV